jgi:energy-coupling factor transport system permease protein
MREYFARSQDSPLGRLDVRVKMAMAFSISLLAVLGSSVTLLGALAVVGLIVFFSGRPNARQVRLVAFTCALVVWGMMFSQAIFYDRYPRHALVTLLEPNAVFRDGLRIYAQGIRYGMVQSMRVLAVMLTGYGVCFSTAPDRFLRGLRAMHVPFSLAFMAVTAVRFIPILAEEFQSVRQAMRLKGYRPFKRGLRDTIRTEIGSLRPVLGGVIRRSQNVALSVVTRGFGFGRERTALRHERLRLNHWLALAAMLVVVGSVATGKLLFWLYQQQIYYSAALRPLYEFTRDWL